jgi:hypothetical protein
MVGSNECLYVEAEAENFESDCADTESTPHSTRRLTACASVREGIGISSTEPPAEICCGNLSSERLFREKRAAPRILFSPASLARNDSKKKAYSSGHQLPSDRTSNEIASHP